MADLNFKHKIYFFLLKISNMLIFQDSNSNFTLQFNYNINNYNYYINIFDYYKYYI